MAKKDPDPGISLADFISKVRNELSLAARQQAEQKRIADAAGETDLVGDLLVSQLEIEANVSSKIDRSTGGGIKLWVVNTSAKSQMNNSVTHRVKIVLTAPSLILGNRE